MIDKNRYLVKIETKKKKQIFFMHDKNKKDTDTLLNYLFEE